jgi:GT2 family glycosyltransferase
MQLTVIIVNYNVKHFLFQCLKSVFAAIKNISAEVIVVDNCSTDGSVEMLKDFSPSLTWIENRINRGFAVANNQGIQMAKGKYILLLNPDTVVAEDTFEKCIRFMEAHSDAGALGVHMIDGKGNFLPESKRGLPTPAVAFYKMFGLSYLFPKSKIFGKYHLGYLDERQTHRVEILSGAFMFIRREALEKAGWLDEAFFMYGEDIDLSYRIEMAGYRNYYFSHTTIIHYKGESTKKGTLNYVKVFYAAMIIFARKHFAQSRAGIFSFLIHTAVVVRGLLSFLASFVASSFQPIFDALLMFGGMYAVQSYWASNVKSAPEYYPDKFLFIVVPAYIFIWIVSVLLSGGYERPYRLSLLFKGLLGGTIIITAIYGLLPNEWRFSRAIILLGTVSSAIAMLFSRVMYNLVKHGQFSFETSGHKSIVIVADREEELRIRNILSQAGLQATIHTTHTLSEVSETARMFEANEIIFSSRSISYQQIIAAMQSLKGMYEFKIVNEGSNAIIGSNSKNTTGEVYDTVKIYALGNPLTLRKKRLSDLGLSFGWVILAPVLLFLPNGNKAIKNIPLVLAGKKTWVGYCGANTDVDGLPVLKEPVFSIAELKQISLITRYRELNEFYAASYSLGKEVASLLKHVFALKKK